MPTGFPVTAKFANRGAYDDALMARGLIAYVDDLMIVLRRAFGWARLSVFR